MKPTIGRIVIYVLTAADAESINARRAARRDCGDELAKQPGAQCHVGNPVRDGIECAAVIVNVFGDTPTAAVNLKVLLDGSDDHWATSRCNDHTKTPGSWHWSEFQQKVAAEAPAKVEAPAKAETAKAKKAKG